ncbi:globin-1-like [Mercenaria mercenaria]|uniref:globin-1-like n=1 Tax=Mercenaria mercenaria TaxID=6596 RepID=UPI00234E596A|nr:globin-1-like [Mercenaria mercenaria]
MSSVDKKNVADTWTAAYKDWEDKNGVAFYERLFENNPEIKAAFTNPDLKIRSKYFGKMVQSWMENLENESTLDEKIGEMCAKHKERGQSDIRLFKDALTELAGFVNDTVGMNSDQQASWQKINDVILDIMKTKF